MALALIYDQRYHTFESWSSLMVEAYAGQQLQIGVPEANWKDWAVGLMAIDLFQNNSFKKRFCPALRTIIVEDNHLVGYITKKGRTLTVSELKRYCSNPMIQKKWKKAIAKYNFFYNDFKANNLIILPSRQISLIDFEAIARLPTGDNVQFTSRNTQIKSKLFNLSWYYRFLEEGGRGRRGRGAVPL